MSTHSEFTPLTDSPENARKALDNRRKQLLNQASSYAAYQVAGIQENKTCSTGKPIFCFSILVTCCLFMLIEFGVNDWKFESTTDNPTLGPSVETLIKMGAKRTDLIVDSGHWYRLFAPILLHGGLLHLAFNMVGLVSIGFPLEREHGSLKLAYIFFMSGFVGVIVSAIFSPTLVGVGASGAIFGLFGAAWSELIQNWSLYRTKAKKALIQLSFATTINLLIGLMPFLDNFSHIAGMITGLFCGFATLVSKRYSASGKVKKMKGYQLTLQVISLIITPLSVVVLLMVLYLGVPIHEWCNWCSKLNCVTIKGAWDCSPCATGGIRADPYSNGTVVLFCPGGQISNTQTPFPGNLTSLDVISMCKLTCPGMQE